MTGVAAAWRDGVPRSAGLSARRVRQLLRTELRLLHRFHVLTATAIVSAGWVAVLLAVPTGARHVLVPVVLLTDVTALGFLFVPALLVLERMDRVDATLRLTPTRAGERVAVRVGVATGLSLFAGAVVVSGAGVPDVLTRLFAVTTMSLLFGLVATTVVGGAATLTTFIVRAPLVAVPLLAPALLHLVGIADAPVLHVSPVTSAVDMLRGHPHLAGVAWQLVWVAALGVAAARTPPGGVAVRAPAHTRRSRPGRHHPGRYRRTTAVTSFARTDRRTLVSDGLVLLLLASVPLVAIVVRVIGTVGVGWVQRRHGVALGPHLPLVQVVLLVLHTPIVLGMLTGLLLLEDRDAGLFGPLAVTRASVATLLAYRLTAVAAVTTTTLALSFPLAAIGHPAGVVGHLSTAVAGGVVSVVPALLMAAVAGNRVQGMAAMKALSLPLYLPLATWFVAAPARWLFAPLPTAWAAWAAWAPSPARAIGMALGAGAVVAALAVPLARRVARRFR